MNVTVFGGTGPAGLVLIEKALHSGHRVTLFARNLSKVSIRHDNLLVIKGELSDLVKIEEAVKSAGAVISLLGPKTKSKELVISNGIKNIIAAMQINGVNRLIAAVSSSYRDPKDNAQFGFDFGVVMLKVLANSILKDIVTIGEQIIHSPLDWTIVRLPMLSNRPAKGKLSIGYTGDGKVKFFSLTRADLADFLIHQISDKTYLRQAPVVSN